MDTMNRSPELEAQRVLEEARKAFGEIGEPFDGYRTDVSLLAFIMFDMGIELVDGLYTEKRRFDAVLYAGAPLIAVDAEHHEHRRRFSVAHEIGHYVLHYQPGQSETEQFWCTTGDLEVSTGGSQRLHLRREWEANRFAAELLMPERPFRAIYAAARGNILHTARHFDVSVKAVEVRLSLLGLPFRPVSPW